MGGIGEKVDSGGGGRLKSVRLVNGDGDGENGSESV